MENYETHYLYPGTLYTSRQPCEITTILGSCVAVCLWDAILNIGGMNHFMLPLWNGEELASPRYGNIAIENLIDKLTMMGSQRRNLQAKVFGGSEKFDYSLSIFSIGKRNIMVAQDLLEQAGIPIVSHSVGGHIGRKIKFYTDTGKVLMKYLK